MCICSILLWSRPQQFSEKEPEKITATSFKVYTQRGSLVCEYYEFMYHGHKYITNYGEKFLLHSPECSCQY